MCRAMWIVLFVAICQVAFGLPQGGFQNPPFGSDAKPSSLPKPIIGQTDNHGIKLANNSTLIKSTNGANSPSHDGPSSSSFPRTVRQAVGNQGIRQAESSRPIKPLVASNQPISGNGKPLSGSSSGSSKPIISSNSGSSKPIVSSNSGKGSLASASEVVSTVVKPDSPVHGSDSNSNSAKKTPVVVASKPHDKPEADDDSKDRNRRGVDDFPSKPTTQTRAAAPTTAKPLIVRQAGTTSSHDDAATTRKSFFPSRN